MTGTCSLGVRHARISSDRIMVDPVPVGKPSRRRGGSLGIGTSLVLALPLPLASAFAFALLQIEFVQSSSALHLQFCMVQAQVVAVGRTRTTGCHACSAVQALET